MGKGDAELSEKEEQYLKEFYQETANMYLILDIIYAASNINVSS